MSGSSSSPIARYLSPLGQVHVAQGRLQILVTRKALDREDRRAAHRQMAAKHVTEDVHRAVRAKPGSALCSGQPVLKRLCGHRDALVRIKDAVAAKVTMGGERRLESLRQRHHAVLEPLAVRHLPFPFRAFDRQLSRRSTSGHSKGDDRCAIRRESPSRLNENVQQQVMRVECTVWSGLPLGVPLRDFPHHGRALFVERSLLRHLERHELERQRRPLIHAHPPKEQEPWPKARRGTALPWIPDTRTILSVTARLDLPIADIVRVARAHGAMTVRVFGSRARGDAGPESDLDLLVALEPGRSLLDLVAIKQDLEDLLRFPVDVVTEASLSPYLRDAVLAEARPLTA
jgi:uncharacterized protein